MISSGDKRDAAIHRLENVGRDLREIGSRYAGSLRFIDRLDFFAAGNSERSAADQSRSDSDETESITSCW